MQSDIGYERLPCSVLNTGKFQLIDKVLSRSRVRGKGTQTLLAIFESKINVDIVWYYMHLWMNYGQLKMTLITTRL